MDRPNLISWVPASVRYDKRLKPNAKLLFSEITALTSKEGFCWAENAYFAELYEVSLETVSRWISQLRECGYIEVEILHNEGNKRRITLDEIVMTSRQKNQDLLTKKSRPLDKKVNPIYENRTINNTIKREENALAFLEKNFPSRYESFLMQYKSKIKDFQKFAADFHDTVVIEKLQWEMDVLFARAGKYARNWIENENRGSKTANAVVTADNTNNPSRKRFNND